MLRFAIVSALLLPGVTAFAVAQPRVSVNPSMPTVPRQVEQQTKRAVVRDYLQSWQAMHSAFEQNRADLLKANFVGKALDRLSGTVKEQLALGIGTHYQDTAHNIQFLFYSPDGMSIEFTDSVTFNLQVFDHGRLVATHQEHAKYLVVMTPAEVNWRVRVFQAMQA